MKIQINHVTKHFGSLTVLSDITFDVRQGEFLTIAGPGGCGKSTLLDLIGGLLKPSAGEILLDGAPPAGTGFDRGVVLQQHALFPWRTALGNVEFGLEATAVPRGERAGLARHCLGLVGLGALGDRYPHELTAGTRQRVAIARSLAYDPDVLLMDEPFAALDTRTRSSLREDLLSVWEKTGKTMVLATRSLDEAAYLGRRVAILTSSPGRVLSLHDTQPLREGAGSLA
ncbi:ABC transporter ATP-binding protein [Nonomuraea sp. NPDC050547]|uniref:ABC transporter ATP-binding protein n=1 Tax=Nonomuraea sp. NPDC050547 TaxID=3364368 RepID=UPI0037B46607